MGVPPSPGSETPSLQPKSIETVAITTALATEQSNRQIHTMTHETNNIAIKQNLHKGAFGNFSEIDELPATSVERAPDEQSIR